MATMAKVGWKKRRSKNCKAKRWLIVLVEVEVSRNDDGSIGRRRMTEPGAKNQ